MDNNNFKEHFLFPSTIYTSNSPAIVKTVLGSCVSVCLWDAINKCGGINHYMLPFWNGKGLASPKYGNIAIQKLIKEMIDIGCKRNNLIAKVFGGGEVIDVQSASFQIGVRNSVIAHEILRDEKIKIVSKSLGGKLGRKIQFNTFNGEVIMRYIKKINCDM
ncbi:MAG: chemotaxis protein CheD [Chlorobi bacterium]|nr:chemotaxis protein CheD [Chlorobiota bacterium]